MDVFNKGNISVMANEIQNRFYADLYLNETNAETLSASLAFHGDRQRAAMQSFYVFFVVRLSKLLNQESRGQWLEAPWCSCDIPVHNDNMVWRLLKLYFVFEKLSWTKNNISGK